MVFSAVVETLSDLYLSLLYHYQELYCVKWVVELLYPTSRQEQLDYVKRTDSSLIVNLGIPRRHALPRHPLPRHPPRRIRKGSRRFQSPLPRRSAW